MMANTQLRFFLFCVCILLLNQTKGVHGQCSTPPINLAGYEGTLNTMLPCNSPTKVSWTLKPTSDELSTYKITNYDDVVTTGYTNLFGVNSTGLIVKKDQTSPVTPPISTSGLYIISINGSTTKYGAKLLVVRVGPNCTCKTSNSTAIQFNCSITYADLSYHPIDAVMNWTSNGNFYKSDTPARTRPNTREFISSSVLQVNGSDEADYQCTVAFVAPRDRQFPYVATNAPAFSASCNVPFCGQAKTTSQTSATEPARTTAPPTTTEPIITTLPITTTEPITTTPPTTKTEPITTTLPITTTEPITITPTTTTESITTTFPAPTTEETTTTLTSAATSGPSSSGCNCSQTTECPPIEQNCTRNNECQSDGTNATDIYDECVVKAELYVRCDNCCSESLVCGVVVTLRNDSRWLIHDPQCDDNKCEMVVADASCMSSDWKLLSERKVIISGVGDYVQTGSSVQFGLNVTDCSDSCRRMMMSP